MDLRNPFCKKHPKYKGVFFPRVDCGACLFIYHSKRIIDRLTVDLPDKSSLVFKKF